MDADLVFVPVTPGSSRQPGPTVQSIVKGNLFAPKTPEPAYVMLMDADGRIPLSVAATRYPDLFLKNQEARPRFVGANPSVAADFQLSSGSPGRGTGVFLTQAVGAGNSNLLRVQDSLYFSDGNGIVPGDMVEGRALSNVSFQQHRLPLTDTSAMRRAELVVSSSAIEYLDSIPEALGFLRDLLEDAGVAIFSISNRDSISRAAVRTIHHFTGRPHYLRFLRHFMTHTDRNDC